MPDPSSSPRHRSKKRRQRQYSLEEEVSPLLGPPSGGGEPSGSNAIITRSNSSSRGQRLLTWLWKCIEGVCCFLLDSVPVRLSRSSLSFLFLPLYELAGPLPDRHASKPWFGLLHRCCLLLLLQRLCFSSASPQELLSGLGALLLLLLLLEVLFLPVKGSRFLKTPLKWQQRLTSLRPLFLVSADSMDSYVIPLVSVFVVCSFFLMGLLVTAFFCFNIYSEFTTLWECAHGLLDAYVFRSASFQEAYTKLSALLRDQHDGLAAASAAASAAAEGRAPVEAPTTLAGFVAAAATAVSNTARTSTSGTGGGGGSSAAMLLGGSLGWYSDLWRIIQELASASTVSDKAAGQSPLASLAWPTTTSRHTDPPPPSGSLRDSLGPPSLPVLSPMEGELPAASNQQQNLVSFVSPWSMGRKTHHLLWDMDFCPRLSLSSFNDTHFDWGEGPSQSCYFNGGPPETVSFTQFDGGWWALERPPKENPWGPAFNVSSPEAFLSFLHDESSLTCIDPWKGPGRGPQGERLVGPPSLAFLWAAAGVNAAKRRGGGGSRPSGSFLSFLFSGDLWRRWPNTAELVSHLRNGNFLSAFKRSLQASQEVYSLTSEAWWRYVSEHAHTLLTWAFNSGFGAWRVCCFVLAFLLRFFLSAFDLLFQFAVFVGALYALLCSSKSTLDLVDEVLFFVDPSAILSASVNEKIRAILFSSVKKVWFYSLFTWLIFESTGMPVVYVPTAVSSLLALLPLLPPEAISFLPSVVLWFHKEAEQGGGGPPGAWGSWLASPHRLAALGVCGANALVWWNVTTSIYREIPDASPWLVGLSAALGLSTLGLKGIILGPVLATMPLIVISAASKFNERHVRSQEALGASDGVPLPQEQPQPQEEQMQQPKQGGGPEGPLFQGPPFLEQETMPPWGQAAASQQGCSLNGSEGIPYNSVPYYPAWSEPAGSGGTRGPQETGGFALGDSRSGKRSSIGPQVDLFKGVPPPGGLLATSAGLQAPSRPHSAAAQSPPSIRARGGPNSLSGSVCSTGTPSPLFGLQHGSGSLGGPPRGAPQQPALAVHFIKSAADAIRWILQRRRSGTGIPPGGTSMGAPPYPWGPGTPPPFLSPQQQQQLVMLPQSCSQEAVDCSRKVLPMGIALREKTGKNEAAFFVQPGDATGADTSASPALLDDIDSSRVLRASLEASNARGALGCRPRSLSIP